MKLSIMLLSILTITTINAAQADYSLKIPIEQQHGGFLPNGSIKLSDINLPTPTDPVEPIEEKWECPTDTGKYSWFLSYESESALGYLRYDAMYLFINLKGVTTYESGGFIYRQGKLVATIQDPRREYYEVCRKLL